MEVEFLDDLSFAEAGRSRPGTRKKIWKLNLSGQTVAAKIYQEETPDGEIINRAQEAIEEFKAYQELRKTPLGEFIPLPLCLLKDRKTDRVIGLAVEWREAPSLENRYPQKPLTHQHIDKLEELFSAFIDTEFVPETDMLNESNVMIEETLEGPKIWFAECGLETSPEEIEAYPRYLKTMINDLRRDYVPK